MAKEKQWFEWTVKLRVHRTWVEDGFDLKTHEQAKEILARRLPYANNWELGARILDKPSRKEIRKAQGYSR